MMDASYVSFNLFTANWDSLWKSEGELILLITSVLWIQTRYFCGWQYIHEILPGKGGEKEFMMTPPSASEQCF